MAEFNNVAVQTVPYAQAAVLNNTAPICKCNRGDGVYHSNGSGLVSLRGQKTYRAQLSGNIALTEGATVGEIAVALAVNGEVLPDTIAAVTPAAVGDFFNVSTFKEVTVPCGCCVTLSIENASPASTSGVNPSIDIRNLNLEVNPI